MMRKQLIISAFVALTVFIYKPSFAQSRWTAPASASQTKNPFTGDASKTREGKLLYVSNCVPCHGEKGKGNGPASAALDPKPADHSSGSVQNQSDGAIFYKMTEGKKPMPAYATLLTDIQRWELVNYIRTLRRK